MTEKLLPHPIDSGHNYDKTSRVFFNYFKQKESSFQKGYEYYLSLPSGYNESNSKEKRYPLILFLHGSGESRRGKGESYATLRHGIPKIILCYDRLLSGNEPRVDIPPLHQNLSSDDQSRNPVPPEICRMIGDNFITVSPSLDAREGYGWSPEMLVRLLEEVEENYRVDYSRIHVTGFSMGGFGTWSLASYLPGKFASLVPICGGGSKDTDIGKIKDIPQWIFHGEEDNIVPINRSEKMEYALKKEGGKEIRFTRFPNTNHDSWTQAYNDIELWKWLLNKRN
eukprot:TRINITY_DN12882_c0_g1_i1.p1 TRINITY_DN12882_c0_g1~~TRINITY_DN12882_c0_g1_i1.p1  ORF type:complete len:282 (-),score=20.50 TRINITY_DN12882_c0_g1_i1:34-879(-)